MPDLEHEPEPVSVEGGYQAYLDLGPTPPQALYPGGYKSIDATQKVIRNDDAQELGCAPEVSVASDHARPLKVDPSICGWTPGATGSVSKAPEAAKFFMAS